MKERGVGHEKAKGRELNYLYLGLGALFLIAVIIIFVYSLYFYEGCIGVIEIKGEIVTEDAEATLFSDEIIGSETLAEQIEEADKRPDISSILLIIDSPGGSVVATRQLYEAISSVNKSTVSYIHELGASGAYYVAAGTDCIVSNPDAITGSIGAKATFTEFSGLFSKLGINETTVKTGAMKDIGSASRPMTKEEYAVVEGIINESFAEFKKAVEKGREGKLNEKEFASALDGRILSGRQAYKIGLVDELGNKKDAIKKAAQLGNISGEPNLCYISSTKGEKGLFGSFFAQAQRLITQAARSIPFFSYQ